MLTAFDLVIFDCDGVLIDSEVLSCECLRTLLGEHGCQLGIEDVFDKFLGRSFSAVESHYESALGRPLAEGFIEAHRERLKAEFQASLRPVQGIEAVLSRMELPFCVASSSDQLRLAFSLSITGLSHWFGDRVYSADQVARGKPAPDLFLYAARQMKAEPSRTLVIEDSTNGVRAAKAAGMTVWGFTGGSHHAGRDGAERLKQAGADLILCDIALLQPLGQGSA